MESKKEFFDIIWKHYNEISEHKISDKLLEGLCIRVADYYYDQYNRCSHQYPKSIKRYSSFQVKDLEHPYTFEIVIKYFKEKLGENYADQVKILLKKTDAELMAFEKSREDFYKMF